MYKNVLLAVAMALIVPAAADAKHVHTQGQSSGIVAACIGTVVQKGRQTRVYGVGHCPRNGQAATVGTVSSTGQTGGVTAGYVGTVNQGGN